MKFLKLLAFLVALVGIGLLLLMIFAGNPKIVSIILTTTISIGGLAVADLAAFGIHAICKSEKLNGYWKSCITMLISSAGAFVISILFSAFLPNIPFMATAAEGLAFVLLIAMTLNLVFNLLYMLFGTGKLTIPWKLFIFFMLLTLIFGVIFVFSNPLNDRFFDGTSSLPYLSLIALCVSILLAVASLLAAIVNGIYSGQSLNNFFKLFIPLIIISATLFGISGLFHVLNREWRDFLIFVSAVILFAGVAVLIVMVFRTIFLEKPLARNPDYQPEIAGESDNDEIDGEEGTGFVDKAQAEGLQQNANSSYKGYIIIIATVVFAIGAYFVFHAIGIDIGGGEKSTISTSSPNLQENSAVTSSDVISSDSTSTFESAIMSAPINNGTSTSESAITSAPVNNNTSNIESVTGESTATPSSSTASNPEELHNTDSLYLHFPSNVSELFTKTPRELLAMNEDGSVNFGLFGAGIKINGYSIDIGYDQSEPDGKFEWIAVPCELLYTYPSDGIKGKKSYTYEELKAIYGNDLTYTYVEPGVENGGYRVSVTIDEYNVTFAPNRSWSPLETFDEPITCCIINLAP